MKHAGYFIKRLGGAFTQLSSSTCRMDMVPLFEEGIPEHHQRIVAAACKYDDLIIVGARHYDAIMVAQLRAIPVDSPYRTMSRSLVVQGFIDNYGVFLDRVQALEVAIAAGQINHVTQKTSPERLLFSEDLY